jgi:hypothetical protein
MPRRPIATVLLIVVLVVLPGFGTALAAMPVAAQVGSPAAGPPETVAVCVNLGTGGDALSLVSWTDAQIADYAAHTGPVGRPHPATGACTDPAGLPVLRDFLGGFSWVCSRTFNGDWYGPTWTANIYRLPTDMPPNPDIGGCPQPRAAAPPAPSAPPDEEQAAATAVYLSRLEAGGDLDTLYAWLHPDAQAVVPREVVAGWYNTEVIPRGPNPIHVTSVEFTDWTWDVTGARYVRTAEIAYDQTFADGSVESDVVRLVQDDQGLWRWFFGRDRAFVDAQIDRFASHGAG